MSVVVRMEMPKCCLDCPCVNGEYGYCQADKEERQIEDPNGRPSWCPIICQLPEGHGRLVDADLFKRQLHAAWAIDDVTDYHVIAERHLENCHVYGTRVDYYDAEVQE